MELPKFRSNEELPLALNAKDVAGYLNVSLTCAYYIMNSKGFPVIKIGKRMIVTKDNFLKWLSETKEVSL